MSAGKPVAVTDEIMVSWKYFQGRILSWGWGWAGLAHYIEPAVKLGQAEF
jgi:hypothetical protein